MEQYDPQNDPHRYIRELGMKEKSEETRNRMREAKLGVEKSLQHRQALSEKQLELNKIYADIKRETGLSHRDAKREWTRRKEKKIRDLMDRTGHSHNWCKKRLQEKGEI